MCISLSPQNGTVHFDIKEWLSSPDGDIKPMKWGVNLSVEEVSIVTALIKEHLSTEKQQRLIDATVAALHHSSTVVEPASTSGDKPMS